MATLATALVYFCLVFGAGFGLGIIRTLWLVPIVGIRTAELLEMPFMLGVIIAAALWITRRDRQAPQRHSPRYFLRVGLIGLGLVLMADLGVGVGLRGMTVTQALFERDLISGIAYYLLLLVYALIPWLISRKID